MLYLVVGRYNSEIMIKGFFGVLGFAIFTFLVLRMFIDSGYASELKIGALLGGVVSSIITYYLLIVLPKTDVVRRNIIIKNIGFTIVILTVLLAALSVFGILKNLLNVPMFSGFAISYGWIFFILAILFKLFDLIPHEKK